MGKREIEQGNQEHEKKEDVKEKIRVGK